MTTRVRYFSGQLLSAADFQAEQDYTRDRLRRHNRWLHGWGVVGGLAISVSRGEIVVAPGLAIDGLGNEIEVCEPAHRALPSSSRPCYLTVAFAERDTDPVGDPPVFSRVEEGWALAYEVKAPARTPPGPARIALARLLPARRGWRVDPRYRARRARASRASSA
ncbi:MAG TPA: hypothetical protein VIW03_14810 [Anaeromyxobacter sp.]